MVYSVYSQDAMTRHNNVLPILKILCRYRLKTLLVNNEHADLNLKPLMYKSLLKSIWPPIIELWDNAKLSNLQKYGHFKM